MGILKRKSIIMAFDDSPHMREELLHNRFPDGNIPESPAYALTKLIGVTFRGHQLLNVMESDIEIDGMDSTSRILAMVRANPYVNAVKLILIDSPTMAGFNVVNPFKIYEETHIPVVLLPDENPHDRIVETYRKVFPERKELIGVLENLPPLERLDVVSQDNPGVHRTIFFHAIGITKNEIVDLLRYLAIFSAIPEPLRVAHIIASRVRLNR